MHLAIDGYGGDAKKLQDPGLLRRFLDEFPSTLGMTKICEPKIIEYDAPKVEDSGVTGFVIIAESHISVHTFPHRQLVNIDIFSCKSFDAQQALEAVKRLFGLQEVETWILERGLEHSERRQAAKRWIREGARSTGGA